MFDPNMDCPNRETYEEWKHFWLKSGRTLDDAVQYGALHSGEAYANQLKQIISKMEAAASEPA